MPLDYNHEIYNLLVQPDGKLLLCQDDPVQGQSVLVRLGPHGLREFDWPLDGAVYAFATQADGKVLIGGSFAAIHDTPVTNLVRLNTDGSIDTTFKTALPSAVTGLAPGDSGTTYVGTGSGLLRLNADGTIDPDFQVDTGGGAVQTIANLGNGRLLIAGKFDQVDGVARPGLARLILATSVPQILNWIRIGPMVRFSAPTLQNTSYTLERTDSMGVAGWTPVDTIVGDGSNRVLVDHNATGSQAFYRVRTP